MLWKKIEQLSRILSKNSTIDSLALGGSYSRGTASKRSDIDLFALIFSEGFPKFRVDFPDILMNDCNMIVASEYFYLEGWGYLFKCIDNDRIVYDISIVPNNRIDELGIKKPISFYLIKVVLIPGHCNKAKAKQMN